MGCQSIARLLPSISSSFPDNFPEPIYTHGWSDWDSVKVKCFAKEHNTMTWPSLKTYTPPPSPPPNPDFNTLTISWATLSPTWPRSKACQFIFLNSRFLHTRHLQEYISKFFFRPYFHYCLLSSVHYCGDLSHIHIFIHCSHMIFIYSQSFIHHSTGLFGINIMISFQLAC